MCVILVFGLKIFGKQKWLS